MRAYFLLNHHPIRLATANWTRNWCWTQSQQSHEEAFCEKVAGQTGVILSCRRMQDWWEQRGGAGHQDSQRKAVRTAATQSFKHVTGAFMSYGARGEEGKAWQADALKQTSISTQKALIKKMATKPRTERFPKTINPWICKLWKWNYCNQYFNRTLHPVVSVLHRQKHSFLESQGCSDKVTTNT